MYVVGWAGYGFVGMCEICVGGGVGKTVICMSGEVCRIRRVWDSVVVWKGMIVEGIWWWDRVGRVMCCVRVVDAVGVGIGRVGESIVVEKIVVGQILMRNRVGGGIDVMMRIVSGICMRCLEGESVVQMVMGNERCIVWVWLRN